MTSFPSAQLDDLINEFSAPFRFDRNSKGSGLLMHICGDIPSRQLFCKSQCYLETISVEIYLAKRKRSLNGSYKPHRKSKPNLKPT